jgi:hypothetical protein
MEKEIKGGEWERNRKRNFFTFSPFLSLPLLSSLFPLSLFFMFLHFYLFIISLSIVIGPNIMRSEQTDMMKAMEESPLINYLTATMIENSETLFNVYKTNIGGGNKREREGKKGKERQRRKEEK